VNKPSTTQKLLILAVAWFLLGGGFGVKATAVSYVYDDKRHLIPPPVASALSKLNERGVVATMDEVDTLDGEGEVPDQYRVSRPAAIKAGLPALVVMGGERVLRVVPSPKTEEAVLGAVD
jgi:hypothetical protein